MEQTARASSTTAVDPEDFTPWVVKLRKIPLASEPFVLVAEQKDINDLYDLSTRTKGIIVLFARWLRKGLDLRAVPIIHLCYCKSGDDARELSRFLGVPVVGVEGSIKFESGTGRVSIVEGPTLETLKEVPVEEAERRVVEYRAGEAHPASAAAPLRRLLRGEAGGAAATGGAGAT